MPAATVSLAKSIISPDCKAVTVQQLRSIGNVSVTGSLPSDVEKRKRLGWMIATGLAYVARALSEIP